MYRYSVLLQWSDEDNCFIASVPDLPGCMADGATPVEAVQNAQEVIGAWIEAAQEDGETIPEPSSYVVQI